MHHAQTHTAAARAATVRRQQHAEGQCDSLPYCKYLGLAKESPLLWWQRVCLLQLLRSGYLHHCCMFILRSWDQQQLQPLALNDFASLHCSCY
jgi:hypothetical protein